MTQIKQIINGKTVIEYEKSMIYIIENIIDNSFCDELIQMINTVNREKLSFAPRQNVECDIVYFENLLKLNDELVYKFSTDNTEVNELLNKPSCQSIYTNKLNGITSDTVTQNYNKVNDTMRAVIDIMQNINPNICFDYNSNYLLRKVYGSTRLHIDNISEINNENNIVFLKDNKKYIGDLFIRSASIIFALNDDYDGGIFNFPYYDIKIKLKKGSVIIFPPYWTHKHEVYTVENNTYRYTLSTWSCMKIN